MSRKDELERKKEEIRQRAVTDLAFLIHLLHPGRALGHCHHNVFAFWANPRKKSHDAVFLPREHQKSALLAYRCVQRILKDPAVRIMYISSTANLAVKQLKFIKDILTSDIVRFYWPDLVNKEESKREKWTETEISVDHPQRKLEFIRDPTVFAAGLTTNVVGLHCDVLALDDIVVFDNAYTDDGRQKLEQQYSMLASVETTGAEQWVVGTFYHTKDLYHTITSKRIEMYDPENGDLISEDLLFDVLKAEVEDRGDGFGQFLWPRMRNKDGKWFGFDANILAKKKAQYLNKTQFRAQYYNDPNDLSEAAIKREWFQYYDKKFLSRMDGKWHFKGRRLNVFAAIDFAYSLSKRADFSSLVVVGVDGQQNYYVLDIERFRGEMPSDYFKVILAMYQKWDFRTLRAEVTAAQSAIVKALKHDYIRQYGLSLILDENRPSRHQGDKEERILSTLQPKYESRQMWHYQGGYCELLEEELMLEKPPHDDIKDALQSAVSLAHGKAPSMSHGPNLRLVSDTPSYHPKFGGVV